LSRAADINMCSGVSNGRLDKIVDYKRSLIKALGIPSGISLSLEEWAELYRDSYRHPELSMQKHEQPGLLHDIYVM
jgi:hypothetical protein